MPATSCPAMQRMSAGRGIMHSEFNPNAGQRTASAAGLDHPGPHRVAASYEQRHTTPAKSAEAALVASPDGAEAR